MHQRTPQPGTPRAPAGTTQHLRPHLRQPDAVGGLPSGRLHQRTGQRADEDRVLRPQADVRHPDLDGGVALGQPGVEVDHRPVERGAGCDEVVDDLLVGGRRAEGTGGPGRRPALPDLRSVGGVAGVDAVPERGVGTHRQKDGQPRPDPVEHGNPLFVVCHLDVHMAAAGELLAGGESVLRRDPAVPERCRDVAGDRKGGGGEGCESGTGGFRCQRCRPALLPQVRVEFGQGETGVGAGLQHLLLELELDAAAGSLLGEPDRRTDVIDQQEFLLDTNRPHGAPSTRDSVRVPKGNSYPEQEAPNPPSLSR